MAETLMPAWQALGRLLNARSQGEIAEQSYRQIRGALIRFLEHHGSTSPEDHADETICRMLKNRADGVWVNSPSAYAYQIAKNVLSEDDRESSRRARVSAEWLRRPQPDSGEGRKLDRCLEKCLQSLPRAERRLLHLYYQAEGAEKIALHEKIAAELGTTAGNLRVRAYRLRQKLNDRVRQCLEPRDHQG
jgi:RNA polymerase sigma factor (sigma-70 family)